MALGAVAVRGKGRSPDGVAMGARSHRCFRGTMVRLLIIERRQRLWKYLWMAHRAIPVHPFIMLRVGKCHVAVGRRDKNGLRRRPVRYGLLRLREGWSRRGCGMSLRRRCRLALAPSQARDHHKNYKIAHESSSVRTRITRGQAKVL